MIGKTCDSVNYLMRDFKSQVVLVKRKAAQICKVKLSLTWRLVEKD